MAEWYENIPTPMDRGGNVVPLDTKKLFCSGKVRAVKEIGYKLNAWVVRVVGEEDFEFLHDCTLPDGWEQLERDVAKDPCGYFGKECDSGARNAPPTTARSARR